MENEDANDALIIFVHRTAIAGFVGTFVHGLAIWAYLYYMIVFVGNIPHLHSSGDGLIVFQFLDARQHSLLHSSVETLPGGAFTAPSSMMSALIVVRTLHFQNSHGLDGRLWSWGSAWIRFLRLMAITEFYTDCK
jgi:hypothetical protein